MIYKYSVFTLVKIYSNTSGILGKCDENTLNEVISSSEFLKLDQKEICKFPNGGYLIEGEIQKKGAQDNQFIEQSKNTISPNF